MPNESCIAPTLMLPKRLIKSVGRLAPLAVAAALWVAGTASWAQGNPKSGQYLASAAGCIGCHTDARPGSIQFAGGRALDTPFGTFYGPNITPHLKTGIGTWSESDLRRAIRQGERPDGAHYFPAFPYPSFSGMTDTDIRDLWAYLKSLPPTDRINRPHDLRFPFGSRFLVGFWKWLFFKPGQFASIPTTALPELQRGAYVVNVLGHCAECHTPRNFLGALDKGRWLSGAKLPEGRAANLTPTRLKKWGDAELRTFLTTGVTPEGDVAADSMSEVVLNTTGRLTPGDLSAMIAYLRSLPAQPENK
jgi:mono/diheme cytochrome c family protein